jgi:hypothetical protein
MSGDGGTDAVTQAREALEREEIAASNNLAHAFQNTPRNSGAIGSLGIFVARYRDAVAARAVAAERQRWLGIVEECKMPMPDVDGAPSAPLGIIRAHNRALTQLAARLTGGE